MHADAPIKGTHKINITQIKKRTLLLFFDAKTSAVTTKERNKTANISIAKGPIINIYYLFLTNVHIVL
jgi:hypothetical protein